MVVMVLSSIQEGGLKGGSFSEKLAKQVLASPLYLDFLTNPFA
jgi:hypothetical protein